MPYRCRECGWEGHWSNEWGEGEWDMHLCPNCKIRQCYEVDYTKVPPTEPGWYWWRYNKEDDPRVYEVNLIMGKLHIEIDEDWIPINNILDGEWSDRLEAP